MKTLDDDIAEMKKNITDIDLRVNEVELEIDHIEFEQLIDNINLES